jgi:hypothetical protein
VLSFSRLLPKIFLLINLKQFLKKSLYDLCLVQKINHYDLSCHSLDFNHAYQFDSPHAWPDEHLPFYYRLHAVRVTPTQRTTTFYSAEKHRATVIALSSIWQTKYLKK